MIGSKVYTNSPHFQFISSTIFVPYNIQKTILYKGPYLEHAYDNLHVTNIMYSPIGFRIDDVTRLLFIQLDDDVWGTCEDENVVSTLIEYNRNLQYEETYNHALMCLEDTQIPGCNN